MAGGVSNATARGRAGKFKKPTRGGGKHFSRDLQPVDSEGNQISMWAAGARGRKKDDDDDDDDEDDSSEEDSSEEEDSDEDAAAAKAKEEASRDDRKAQKKARKEAAIARQKAKDVQVGDLPSSEEDSDEDEDEDMPANPNHSKAARKQAAKPVVAADEEEGVEAITEGVDKMKVPMSRKEREAVEAKAAKERYMKMHTAGKTDEAKADLARLKVIREQRAAEAARRQAEKEERDAQEASKKAEIEAREARRREAAAGAKKGPKKK